MSDLLVESLLSEVWGFSGARVGPLPGGMSSLTWSVRSGDRHCVLKSVNAARYGDRFAAGLRPAARLSAAGLPAGAPIPTLDGSLTVVVDDRALALLDWVAGEPVEQDSHEGRLLIGRTLARAHRLLGFVPGRERIEPCLDSTGAHLGIRPWIRPALARARQAVEDLGVRKLTWGHLHGDPAAEAFLRLDGGIRGNEDACGLIDWGAYSIGPLVFDLASAVMYAGGIDQAEPLIAAYHAQGVVPMEEIAHALGPLLGWRWASQAWYFSRRLATGDLTGITDVSENEKGLADAETALTALGYA
jgi:homoserine kinase type II